MEECEESLRTFHYRPPKGCDMTDDKKMDKTDGVEAKKTVGDQLRQVVGGQRPMLIVGVVLSVSGTPGSGDIRGGLGDRVCCDAIRASVTI